MRTPQADHRAYLDTRFFGSLNGLRCFCIALVLWHHGPLYALYPDLPMILKRGFTGVDLFFVLSGYLITTLLLREETRRGRFSLSAFYWRRICRIIPVYFLLIFVVAAWWIGVRDQDQWWSYLPYYFFFAANFLDVHIPLLRPMWSLAVEEQYYLVWPLVLLILPALGRIRGAVLVAMILFTVLVETGVLPEVRLFPPTELARFVLPMGNYSAILIGSLLGVVLHHPRGFAAAARVVSHPAAPLVFLSALFAAWQWLPETLRGWPAFFMYCLMALLLASLVVREDHWLAPVLRARPIARVGEISYGLYLWHLCGLHIAIELTGAFGPTGTSAAWIEFPIFLVLSIAIAELSFRYFESYFLRLKTGGVRRRAIGA